MLKKILACGSVVAFTLVNLLIAAEIFINTVTVTNEGIPINMLLSINDLYDNVFLGAMVVTGSVIGTIGLAYLICRMYYRNKNAALYGAAFLTAIGIMLDAVIAMIVRYKIGGYNSDAIQRSGNFALISTIFLLVFVVHGGLYQMRRKVN